MPENVSIASEWLTNEDSQCFDDRLSRLKWLESQSPQADYWAFPGGLLAKSLFEEARYCFVYGQFLATTVLGLAYIEITLSALFFEAGRNDLKRAGISELLAEAQKYGLINRTEFRALERARNRRNAYAHFREPGHKDGIERRSINEEESPYSVIEKDATDIVAAALDMVAKNSL